MEKAWGGCSGNIKSPLFKRRFCLLPISFRVIDKELITLTLPVACELISQNVPDGGHKRQSG